MSTVTYINTAIVSQMEKKIFYQFFNIDVINRKLLKIVYHTTKDAVDFITNMILETSLSLPIWKLD